VRLAAGQAAWKFLCSPYRRRRWHVNLGQFHRRTCGVLRSGSSRLLDQVRDVVRIKRSIRTEQAYLQWIRRYILFHYERHPSELGSEHLSKFFSHLAVSGNVAASTQNQALNAILFLYREVLRQKLPRVEELLGHSDVKTTMIYTHVLNRGGRGALSPLDAS